MKKGFTLIEMIVVIGIIAVLGIILTEVFVRSLRGNNKTQVLAIIKQNGQAVLETMDKNLRGSDALLCPDTQGDTMVAIKDGIYTRHRIIVESVGTNGVIQKDNPSPQVGETQELFATRVCASSDPLTSPITTLTDANTLSGTSIKSGNFTRNKVAGFRDLITISFVLGPAVSAGGALTGQIDPVTFQTTVQLR